MNRSSRMLWLNSVNEIKTYMSTKSNVSTHYEILNLKSSCTQGEIKSAYYELSKKYHPDKNTSSDAKKMFQDVSNAYEVLGNFNSRKLYDRDLQARGHRATTATVKDTMADDPLSGFYRSRRGNIQQSSESFNSYCSFDFNEWSRSHYGAALERKIKDQRSRRWREELKVEYMRQQEESKKDKSIILLFTVGFAVVTMIRCFSIDHDKNKIEKYNKKE